MTVQISVPGSSSLARATDNALMLAYVWEISLSHHSIDKEPKFLTVVKQEIQKTKPELLIQVAKLSTKLKGMIEEYFLRESLVEC